MPSVDLPAATHAGKPAGRSADAAERVSPVIQRAPRPARLRYATDTDPGYRRVGRGMRVRYLDSHGRQVRDPAELERIRTLAIPPAWTDVWICADPRGHLQAVGRDARGRKQYRYHPEWRRRRDLDKYERMIRFARRLPRIREAVEADLRRRGLPRERVLALVVRILDETHLRIGGDDYARSNGSFGLTTLRDRQARVDGHTITFRFRGKGGRWHAVGIQDRRLARLLGRTQDLPGQRLFEYLDERGQPRPIRSQDVNAYLRSISGAPITAKDFRTWAGTIHAFRALVCGPAEDGATDRQRLTRAVELAAERLGNTPAVTRSSYIDPSLVEAWRSGDLARLRLAPPVGGSLAGRPTDAEEAALLRLLERRRRLRIGARAG